MNLPFDETYLLNLVERPDKYATMHERISKMGWNVIDFRAVRHPFSDKIVEKFGNTIDGLAFNIDFGGVFNCTREQYTIIRSAFIRGAETVAIIEDDVSFYNDMPMWEKYLTNLPDDWDILRFCSHRGSEEEEYFSKTEDLWVKQQSFITGTGMYAMNRKGMEYMLRYVDTIYCPIDIPITAPTDYVNVYIPKFPISLVLEDSLKSDIRGWALDYDISEYTNQFKDFDRSKYI